MFCDGHRRCIKACRHELALPIAVRSKATLEHARLSSLTKASYCSRRSLCHSGVLCRVKSKSNGQRIAPTSIKRLNIGRWYSRHFASIARTCRRNGRRRRRVVCGDGGVDGGIGPERVVAVQRRHRRRVGLRRALLGRARRRLRLARLRRRQRLQRRTDLHRRLARARLETKRARARAASRAVGRARLRRSRSRRKRCRHLGRRGEVGSLLRAARRRSLSSLRRRSVETFGRIHDRLRNSKRSRNFRLCQHINVRRINCSRRKGGSRRSIEACRLKTALTKAVRSKGTLKPARCSLLTKADHSLPRRSLRHVGVLRWFKSKSTPKRIIATSIK
mmetsp:Transcript_8967/g.19445  ORF Transcript_8967/g.19445 Transcript_8967/m.19445 type:complete len:333 (-) Transcript_8967:1309-2307(-)